jgi:ATP-dependent Clp protease ATP-binding subunit ClpA
MEEGRLTDNVGRTIDFKNTILIMTTNIGAEQIVGRTQITDVFRPRTEQSSYEKMKDTLKQEMERNFRPEFLNRVDDIIVFRSLTQADLKNIVDIELVKVAKRVKDKNLNLMLTDEAKEYLIAKGTSLEFGARPLRRAIEHHLEDPLAEELLQGSFQGLSEIRITAEPMDGQKELVTPNVSQEQRIKLTEAELRKLNDRLAGKHVELQLTDGARELVFAESLKPAFGGRGVRNAVSRLLEDPLLAAAKQQSDGTEGVQVFEARVTEENGQKKIAFEKTGVKELVKA